MPHFCNVVGSTGRVSTVSRMRLLWALPRRLSGSPPGKVAHASLISLVAGPCRMAGSGILVQGTCLTPEQNMWILFWERSSSTGWMRCRWGWLAPPHAGGGGGPHVTWLAPATVIAQAWAWVRTIGPTQAFCRNTGNAVASSCCGF